MYAVQMWHANWTWRVPVYTHDKLPTKKRGQRRVTPFICGKLCDNNLEMVQVFDIFRLVVPQSWELGLAMFNAHTKFEVSMITCNEDMKGNAKWKNSRFEPPFAGLRDDVHGSFMARWKAHCRLPISDNWTFFANCHAWKCKKWNAVCPPLTLNEQWPAAWQPGWMARGSQFYLPPTRLSTNGTIHLASTS